MKERKYIGYGVIVVVLAVLIWKSFYVVSPGYRGVMVTYGKISQRSYTNGIGFKWPISQMYSMDIRTKTVSDSVSTYTSDVQPAEINYVLTYNLCPDNVHILYETVGSDYVSKKIMPILNDALKDVIGKWQAQELVSNRDKARIQVQKALINRLDKRFFQNVTFQIIDLDYSDNFEMAIENKVIAEQKAQEAVNNTKRIQEEAEQKVIAAKAESEAMRIKTEALSRDRSLIDYEAIQKWDGKLPTYMLGDAVPFINMSK